MSLADDFTTLLHGVRDIAVSPEFKDAVGRDIAALEAAAQGGLDAVERHVAGWFGTVYGTDPGTGAAPVTPAAPVADPPPFAAGGTITPPGGIPAGDGAASPLPGQEPLPGT